MVDKIFYPQPIIPAGPSGGGQSPKTQNPGQVPFRDVLEKQIASDGLKFSAHAQQRLASRNIQLSPADLAKINDAVERAAKKGAKDSLVMMSDLALVVSIKNKTVVTAVDNASMKEHVFTNIDSAVII